MSCEQRHAAAADRGRARRRRTRTSAVVRRDDAGAGVRMEVPLVAVGREIGPVAVDHRARVLADPRGRCADERGRRSSGCRPHRSPAGARSSTERPSAVVARTPTTRPSRHEHVGHRRAVVHSTPGGDGGPHEDGSSSVRRGAYRASTPCDGLDADDDALVAVAEGRAPHRRRAGRDDLVEQAPARQLETPPRISAWVESVSAPPRATIEQQGAQRRRGRAAWRWRRPRRGRRRR